MKGSTDHPATHNLVLVMKWTHTQTHTNTPPCASIFARTFTGPSLKHDSTPNSSPSPSSQAGGTTSTTDEDFFHTQNLSSRYLAIYLTRLVPLRSSNTGEISLKREDDLNGLVPPHSPSHPLSLYWSVCWCLYSGCSVPSDRMGPLRRSVNTCLVLDLCELLRPERWSHGRVEGDVEIETDGKRSPHALLIILFWNSFWSVHFSPCLTLSLPKRHMHTHTLTLTDNTLPSPSSEPLISYP